MTTALPGYRLHKPPHHLPASCSTTHLTSPTQLDIRTTLFAHTSHSRITYQTPCLAGNSTSYQADCLRVTSNIKMSLSIEELDVVVRTFYEGRGEAVSHSVTISDMTTNDCLAKTSSKHPKSSMHTHDQRHNFLTLCSSRTIPIRGLL